MAVCEADNEVLRIREELQLLPQEMRAHLQYLQQLLATQGGMEAALLAAQRAPTTQLDAAADGLVAAGYAQLGGMGRYQPSALQLIGNGQAVSGALSYLRMAKLEVQQMLASAMKLIGALNIDGVLSVDVEQESEDVDSEGSGYAPDSGLEAGDDAVS